MTDFINSEPEHLQHRFSILRQVTAAEALGVILGKSVERLPSAALDVSDEEFNRLLGRQALPQVVVDTVSGS